MSSSCFRQFSLNFKSCDLILGWIYDKDIIKIVTKPSSENINFWLINSRSMPPSCQKRVVLHFPFLPFELPYFSSLQQTANIHAVNIAKTSIFGVTACNHVKLVVYEGRRMESASTWSYSLFGNWHFSPTHIHKIEYPKVI